MVFALFLPWFIFTQCRTGGKQGVDRPSTTEKKCCDDCGEFELFIKENWKPDSLGIFSPGQAFIDVFEGHKSCMLGATKQKVEDVFGPPSNEISAATDVYYYDMSKGCLKLSGTCLRLRFPFDSDGKVEYLPTIGYEPRD